MLSHRRRSLLTLASYGTWDFDLASFPYVYNSLLPNGSEVVKGKIAKIYANGVIENQLVQNGNFSDGTNGWNINGDDYATYTTTNEQIMFTVTVQNDGHWSASKYINTNTSTNAINWYANHKYLVVCEAYTEKAGNVGIFYGDDYDSPYTSLEANKWQTVYGFRTQSTNSTSTLQFSPFFVSGMEVGKKYGFRNIRVFDLTLMFGTGNEPTTLTDNRIKNLLNRGYIVYNQGEYKGTNVGEIATEPYNIWDEQVRYGLYAGDGEFYTNPSIHRICSLNKIAVFPNTTYYSNGVYFFYRYEYDKNGNFLREASGFRANFTTSSDCYYINFSTSTNVDTYLNNISFSLADLGYKKHKPSASIPFIYQGNGALNAHDTFEITSSEYVFTKNVNSADFGSLNWEYAGANIFYVGLTGVKSTSDYELANLICDKYATVERSDLADKTICISSTDLITKDSSYTNANTYKSTMSGTYVYYELATPQVVRIPRKHLGIVDLGSLSWAGSNGNFSYYMQNLNFPNRGLNEVAMYCSKYINGTSSVNQSIRNNAQNIAVYDTTYTDATTFKNAMQGIYLFYETAEEVDDIATRIFTENGGSVTTNVRESVGTLVTNGNFDNASSWTCEGSTCIVSSNKAIITIGGSGIVAFYQGITKTSNHKYFLRCMLSSSVEQQFKVNWGATLTTRTINTTPLQIDLFFNTPSGNNNLNFTNNTLTSGSTIEISKVMLFDLTEAFGSGNEPTSIDDPRIVELSTSGMIIRKPTEVLPNLDLDLPVKV